MGNLTVLYFKRKSSIGGAFHDAGVLKLFNQEESGKYNYAYADCMLVAHSLYH